MSREQRVSASDFGGFEPPAGVPAGLVLRYSIDAKYGGGEQMRKDAAGMKRTAASLEKTAKGFGNLPQRQKEILSSAAQEMRGLAAALTRLALWADRYKDFSDKKRNDEETVRLETFAARRWGHDQHAHEFEAAVLLELNGLAGREDFVAWMQAQELHQKVRATGLGFECDGSFYEARLDKNDAGLRLRVAKFLMNMEPRERIVGFGGELMTHGRNLLDRYIKYRRSIDELARRAVEKAAAGS
ncbi:MAG: hypothetical protein M0Z99_34810 [Betaproteobacteria bacterium]|nr:hypothetical protein [Betaproteobacteria bacterium]